VDIDLPTSGYYLLQLIILACRPENNNASLNLLTSSDGGSTFAGSSSDYETDPVVGGGDSPDRIRLDNNLSSSSAQGGIFTVDIASNASASLNTTFCWTSQIRSAGVAQANAAGGFRAATEANDAIRLFMGSGDIAAGTFILMGLPS
jgi:hypothetical protein